MLRLKIEETNLKINRLMNSAIKGQNEHEINSNTEHINIQ
jgi:hypothetical protein